jgi:hypothetical protein
VLGARVPWCAARGALQLRACHPLMHPASRQARRQATRTAAVDARVLQWFCSSTRCSCVHAALSVELMYTHTAYRVTAYRQHSWQLLFGVHTWTPSANELQTTVLIHVFSSCRAGVMLTV